MRRGVQETNEGSGGWKGEGRRRSALIALAGALGLGCRTLPPPEPFTGQIPPFQEDRPFAVVSDLQRTALIEFWRESNARERELVVQAIAAARPAFLAITGDLVFSGGSPEQWAELDALCAPLREASIPVVAAFGNHEYWGGSEGEDHFFARFPHLERQHWYSLAYGPVRLIILDSNVDELTESGWRKQLAWYERTLGDFDRDPDVRGVLVLLHHPPYTNSSVTSDEPHVQRDFVPPFRCAKKTLAMISGHVHSYERFVREGKTFVVSGGGGGPRARLRMGDRRQHKDDSLKAAALRNFHYLTFQAGKAGLAVTATGLPKGGSEWGVLDRFELPWPAAEKAAVQGCSARATE
ncbi:MAG TPA: metallophosphoesterase [Polyangiaceae bacterium]|nr:metallophosphoesterase [Polyangiaceae bacterium]